MNNILGNPNDQFISGVSETVQGAVSGNPSQLGHGIGSILFSAGATALTMGPYIGYNLLTQKKHKTYYNNGRFYNRLGRSKIIMGVHIK